MQEEITTSEKKEDRLFTVAEVARRLRVDGTTVRRWINNGSLEAVTLPYVVKEQIRGRRSYRVKESTIAALIGENEKE